MYFFDWFLLCVLIIDMATIIFGLVCKLNPQLLKNDTVRYIYEFMLGRKLDVEEYEDV